MTRSLYLINPAATSPFYYGNEGMTAAGYPRSIVWGDLATTTVAALAPDDFEIRICDEHISPVDLDCAADIVGLTGKISQWTRMKALATHFRKRGATVLIGGPYASLRPEIVAPYADVLVCGELEEIAAELFSDLAEGRPKERYQGTRSDLALSPVPSWNLYPNHASLSGCVQTSRGCPFDCEFCEVIRYQGRRQRHKPVANVLQELDNLYRLGYRAVTFADDNLTANRQRAKELLSALGDWNRRLTRGNVTFSTQLSIDVARDEDVVRLLAEAGVTRLNIGIETPNQESLREAGKVQNLGGDLLDHVRTLHDHGIMVVAAMIIGFDSDGPDIFQRHHDFVTQAAIPVVSVGALMAPFATPLHVRLVREGRLTTDGEEGAAVPWATNIVPKQMTRSQLLDGLCQLTRRLYHPAEFGDRVVRFIDQLGSRRDPRSKYFSGILQRRMERDAAKYIAGIALLGLSQAKMMARIMKALVRKPSALDYVASALHRYRQARYSFDMVEPAEPLG